MWVGGLSGVVDLFGISGGSIKCGTVELIQTWNWKCK